MTYASKWVVGMMSGTSLDGIDVAAVKTDGESIFEVGPGQTYPYDKEFTRALRSILDSHELTPYIQEVEKSLTRLHAVVFHQFLKDFHIDAGEVRLVGFHGHTILHESPKKFSKGRTWQIGDGALLAKLIQTPVVGQLRTNDVAYGGEGAPLVPIYHQALLQDIEKPVAVLNIGGVANVTWIGRDKMIAFDTGPGNALINDWVLRNIGRDYDDNGFLAAQGKVNEKIIAKFSQHPYFSLKPPKSLGRDEFGAEWVKNCSVEDGAACLTEMTAVSVREALKFLPQAPKVWYVSGGGRYNTTLMTRLQFYLHPALVQSIDVLGDSGDFIEAQAWAFLAVRSERKLPITFPETTGVSKPITGGVLFAEEVS